MHPMRFLGLLLIGLLLGCLARVLMGCPSGPFVHVPPPPADEVVDSGEYKQVCRVEWYGTVVVDSYEELRENVEFQIANNICTADHVLCIILLYDQEGTAETVTVKFKTLEDVPRTSLKDADGNYIIHYLNEDL